METPLVSNYRGRYLRHFLILKSTTMLELFIELTNQLFWDGYAHQLAQENPAGFQMELVEFMNSYNS